MNDNLTFMRKIVYFNHISFKEEELFLVQIFKES